MDIPKIELEEGELFYSLKSVGYIKGTSIINTVIPCRFAPRSTRMISDMELTKKEFLEYLRGLGRECGYFERYVYTCMIEAKRRKTNENIENSSSVHIPLTPSITHTIKELAEKKDSFVFDTRNVTATRDEGQIKATKYEEEVLAASMDNGKVGGHTFFSHFRRFELFSNEGIKFCFPIHTYGKGIDEVQAVVSGIFETFERHYSLPNEFFFPGYEANQVVYKRLTNGNSTIARFQHNRENMRNKVMCLYDEDENLVPAENVFWVYLSQYPLLYLTAGENYSGKSSTGLAAGKNKVESKFQGLMEVIERASTTCPTFTDSFYIDSRSVEDEKTRELIEEFNPVVVSYENAFGIPVFGALNGNLEGSGAHLDGAIALSRALREMALTKPHAGIHDEDKPELPTRSLNDILRNYSTGNDEGDLELTERLLRLNGVSPIYVNLKQRKSDIYVYKTIVPELFVRR